VDLEKTSRARKNVLLWYRIAVDMRRVRKQKDTIGWDGMGKKKGGVTGLVGCMG
jgi:hypothetical protein